MVVVMPGRLCRQLNTDSYNLWAHKILDGMIHSLESFEGRMSGLVMDSDMLLVSNHGKMADAIRLFMERTPDHAVVCADRINERDRNCSALSISQNLIARMGLVAGRDVVCLTGSGWDGTDHPLDLMCYAFRGLGYQTILDPNVRLPRPTA